MKGTAVEKLGPREIVARARGASEENFLRDMDGPLLLVRVDDLAGEIALVLQRGSLGDRAPLLPSIGFRTMTRMGDEPSVRPRAPFGPKELKLRLGTGPHFVVPLHKRAGGGKDFIERVSVGRAMNNDIVIRHESVSKLHAWFVRDEENNIYGADAGSRNRTLLNGEALATLSPEQTFSGDTLRFGAVDTILCSAAVFWQTVTA